MTKEMRARLGRALFAFADPDFFGRACFGLACTGSFAGRASSRERMTQLSARLTREWFSAGARSGSAA
jgi:hypothetical protein